MTKAKEIFDKRYLYYRDALKKTVIPLEARQLIFNVMQEYADQQTKELTEAVERLKFRNIEISLERNKILGAWEKKDEEITQLKTKQDKIDPLQWLIDSELGQDSEMAEKEIRWTTNEVAEFIDRYVKQN